MSFINFHAFKKLNIQWINILCKFVYEIWFVYKALWSEGDVFLKLLNNTPNFYHGTYDCEEAQSVIDGGLIPDQPYNSWTLALDYTYTNMLKGW